MAVASQVHYARDFVCDVNRRISRSGALHPGQLRTPDQRIGVSTRYGPQQLIDTALSGSDVQENSLATHRRRSPRTGFNTLLAAAYINGRHDGVKDLLRTHGLVGLPAGDGCE